MASSKSRLLWDQLASIDAILAANAGFLLAGGLSEPWPGLEAITTMKLHLGSGALGWLHRRLEAAQARQGTPTVKG